MILGLQKKSVLIYILLSSVSFLSANMDRRGNSILNFSETVSKTILSDKSLRLKELNEGLYKSILHGDTLNTRLFLGSVLTAITDEVNDSITLSDSYYYIGVFYMISGDNSESSKYFTLSSGLREKLKTYDAIYAKNLYNLGFICNNLGDFDRMKQYTLRSLEVERKLFGDSDSRLAQGYSSLVSACLGLKEYEQAINYGRIALQLIEPDQEVVDFNHADLYTNLGVCYIKVSDFTKAVLYLENAEALYNNYDLPKDERYINLLNTLASVYFFLNQTEKSDKYFEQGLKIAESLSSLLSFNFVSSFANVIGNAGEVEKGNKLLLRSLRKAEKEFGPASGTYIYVLENYADYLRKFRIDIKKSLTLYTQCVSYLEKHTGDRSLYSRIMLGYALSLADNGESHKALEVIQQNVYADGQYKLPLPETDNPVPESIKNDQWSLGLFRAKHRILTDIFNKTSDVKYLIAAAATSELIVSLLEKLRINIDEEESRIVLGDRYRDFYLNAIQDCDLCYKKTGQEIYIEKAFELSERSKAAALLTSTRELKATQFHIPPEIAELERSLQSEISLLNAKISEETDNKDIDSVMITEWKKVVFRATQKRDSLIDIFEKEYPGYYFIKYNTRVAKASEIPQFAGRNTNYISYVTGEKVIYIFVVNRKNRVMTTVEIDSLFFDKTRDFRKLLSAPSLFSDARKNFIDYQRLGTEIYNIVLRPAKKYLISDRLLISPDYILSYIPFEVLPESEVSGEGISYSGLPYLMQEYRISYTYSATFLNETLKAGFRKAENIIAFAPYYSGSVSTDSLLSSRQQRFSKLNDLPYARLEAEFASNFVGGKLCLNNDAKESVFKGEAGNFDIIHLAMHTVLNDQKPMQSKMIFSQVKDSTEDGMLNTYEVYGIPLKAKMVVLSSCNTGSGLLHTGEGILSLARGFMYSGSQSVIMSLWEIEDKSGTEIIEDFYRYLKKGYNKSNALRHARLNYLKKADMLKAHPYFWSTLVIYGNNEPIFHPEIIKYLVGFVFISILLVLLFHYRRSR